MDLEEQIMKYVRSRKTPANWMTIARATGIDPDEAYTLLHGLLDKKRLKKVFPKKNKEIHYESVL